MLALSTCWNAHRHVDGQAMLAEVRALGFEVAELGHSTRLSLVDGVQRAVAGHEMRIGSLHNFCPLPPGVLTAAPNYYLPSSPRDHERSLAVRYTKRTIDWAATLGAKVVVLHLGAVSMRDYTGKLLRYIGEGKGDSPRFHRVQNRAWRVRSARIERYYSQVLRTMDEIVPHAQAAGIRLGLETRQSLEEIPTIEEVADLIARYGTEVVTYWHDVGHACTQQALGRLDPFRVLETFRGQTSGIHLQDVIPPATDHLPPGAGTVDFERLAAEAGPDPLLVWEIHPRCTTEELSTGLAKMPRVWQSYLRL
jgi:sugar phosphate isomerase/epimerase